MELVDLTLEDDDDDDAIPSGKTSTGETTAGDTSKATLVEDIAVSMGTGEPTVEENSIMSFSPTNEEWAVLKGAWKIVPIERRGEVVVKCGAQELTRECMVKLYHKQWLNDQVINGYIQHGLSRRDEVISKRGGGPRSWFLSSFFVSALLQTRHPRASKRYQYKHKAVARWSKKVPGGDIFSLKRIFFPINFANKHWMLAVACIQERRILFFDSFGRDKGDVYLRAIARYLRKEHKRRKGTSLDMTGWVLETSVAPKQTNTVDCGVFVSMIADFLSRDLPLNFGEEHMTHCRKRIALSLLRGWVA